jgi:hypothetical protein
VEFVPNLIEPFCKIARDAIRKKNRGAAISTRGNELKLAGSVDLMVNRHWGRVYSPGVLRGTESSFGIADTKRRVSAPAANAAGFTDNQKLAHEFEHGRQVLDREVSYKFNPDSGNWDPFAHDLTDEANGWAAGFAMEMASPGQGTIINGGATALKNGILSLADHLGSHTTYSGLPMQLNVPRTPLPGVYEVPK